MAKKQNSDTILTISEKKFRKLMKDHFTGCGNQWDEPEDIGDFENILNDVVAEMGGKRIPRKLPVVNGYTYDDRLVEFRKFVPGFPPEVISIRDPKFGELINELLYPSNTQ